MPYATLKIEIECDHEWCSREEEDALATMAIAAEDALAMLELLPAGWTAKEVT